MSAPDPVQRAREDGWRLEGDPEVLAALVPVLLPDPIAALEGRPLLRATSQRRVARLELPGVGAVLVKCEREAGAEGRARALVRTSHAHAEWAAACALHERGIPVPQPLAYGALQQGMVRTTFFAARFVPDLRRLDEVLPTLPSEEARTLLTRVGAEVRRMQRAGFDHRDLHPGNVLLGSGAEPAIWLIDLHRGRLEAPDEADALSGLVPLLGDLRHEGLGDAGVHAAVLAGWSEGRPVAEAGTDLLAMQIASRRRAKRRKHDRWALEASPWYERLQAPLRGVRVPELTQARVEARLEEHDRLLASGGPDVLKDRPKSAVTRQGGIVVKETRVRGWRGWLKRTFAPGRLVAGHVNAHRLRVRAIPTARSLALARRDGRIFTLYEDLGRLPRLDDLVRRLYAPGGERAAQVRLRDASADWLADLHARGVYHGDVKSLHVLVDEGPVGPVFVLIDTDRLKLLPRRVGAGRRLKNLAQLDASIPVSVTRSERLRWWRRYASRLGVRENERSMMRRLARLLAKKLRVVHAPIE